jgi:hypothetical protein
MVSEELLYDGMLGGELFSDVGRDSFMEMVGYGCIECATRLRLENDVRNG